MFAINPALFKDLRYDPQKDFDLLSVAVRTPNVLVANPGFPGKQRSRADRASQKESRQGHVRVLRHRLVRSSDRRAVLAEDRHDRHPRAVSGRRPGHQRPDRRPCQRVVPESRRDRAAGEGRTAEGAGRHQRQAHRDAAGRSHHGGSRREGSRGLFLAGCRRAERSAGRRQGEARSGTRGVGAIARRRRRSSKRSASMWSPATASSSRHSWPKKSRAGSR